MSNQSPLQTLARGLYPLDHPAYRPIEPPLSVMAFAMAVNTAWTVGYQRGREDGAASVAPRVIEKRVTVTKRSDAAAIIRRVREFGDSIRSLRDGKGKILVDYDRTMALTFDELLKDLQGFASADRPESGSL
jgi:hypothetical protein